MTTYLRPSNLKSATVWYQLIQRSSKWAQALPVAPFTRKHPCHAPDPSHSLTLLDRATTGKNPPPKLHEPEPEPEVLSNKVIYFSTALYLRIYNINSTTFEGQL